MTVVFADVCGSTKLYRRLGDQAARAIINAGLNVVVDVLPRHRGRLVKTIGDEVMCVFADPCQAALAAVEMQTRTAAERPAGMALKIHVGLHHGPVLVEDADVFGDTVNAASYLRAVASAGQILTTQSTVDAIGTGFRFETRPLFFTVIKGSGTETAIHQVIWEADAGVVTDVNLHRHNSILPDKGGLIVAYDGTQIRIDMRRPEVVLGREENCDICVIDMFASRRHALLALRQGQVYLIDQSSNGTFVRRDNGEVVHVFRAELLLDEGCEISLGRGFDQEPVQRIAFSRDRRALYRV